MSPSQPAQLDRQALNIIQRAVAVSRGEKPRGAKHDDKNFLDIHHSSLSKILSGSVLQHFIPGIIAFVAYNCLIKLNPNLHPLIAYYLSFLLFVIPYEIIQILRISKELTGKYIPDHLSHVFVFCPPHSSEYTQQKAKTESSSGRRLLNLFVELLRLMRVVHPLTLFMNFMWHFISFSFIGNQEASFYRNTVVPFIFTKIDSLIALSSTDSSRFLTLLRVPLSKIRTLGQYVTTYPAALPPLTFQSLHGWAGLAVIFLAYVFMPVVEELYYRGLCLPTLVNAAERTLAQWEMKRLAEKKKEERKKEEKNKKKDSSEDDQVEDEAKDTTSDKTADKTKKKKKAKTGKKSTGNSEDVATAAAATAARLGGELDEREKKDHGVTRAERQASKAFLKDSMGSLPKLLCSPYRFALENPWLMHSFLYSFAFFLVNPWVSLSRMIAFVGISQNILSSGIMSMSLQVQYILAFIQFMNIVNKVRGKYNE